MSTTIGIDLHCTSPWVPMGGLRTRGPAGRINTYERGLCKLLSFLKVVGHHKYRRRSWKNHRPKPKPPRGVSGGCLFFIVPCIGLWILFSPLIIICYNSKYYHSDMVRDLHLYHTAHMYNTAFHCASFFFLRKLKWLTVWDGGSSTYKPICRAKFCEYLSNC